MRQVRIELQPGGWVASGGTRRGVKLDRFWQSPIRVDPSVCPFENTSEEGLPGIEAPRGWRILKNAFTPHPFHALIIPSACWPEKKLRRLGGVSQIKAALTAARALINRESADVWLGVHVGHLAGQNLGHLHYHLIQPLEVPRKNFRKNPVLKRLRLLPAVFKKDMFTVAAGGCRAGQCFFYADSESCKFSDSAIAALARVIDKMLGLYSRRFRSSQGLPPDFMIGIKFSKQRMVYGYYLPILNNWGFTEYFALLEQTPFDLPWPHSESGARLREVRHY